MQYTPEAGRRSNWLICNDQKKKSNDTSSNNQLMKDKIFIQSNEKLQSLTVRAKVYRFWNRW